MSETPIVQELSVDQLIPDDKNPNKGTDRGRETVRNSITELGFGRSILIDRNGKIISGNKSTEAAIKAGLKTVKVIKTSGDEIIAVQRVDVDLDSEKGRKFAVADNRAAELGIEWDAEVISELTGAGVDLASFFTDVELQQLCKDLADSIPDDGELLDDEGEDDSIPQGIKQFNLFIAEEIYEQFCEKVDGLLEKRGLDSATDLIVDLVMKA